MLRYIAHEFIEAVQALVTMVTHTQQRFWTREALPNLSQPYLFGQSSVPERGR